MRSDGNRVRIDVESEFCDGFVVYLNPWNVRNASRRAKVYDRDTKLRNTLCNFGRFNSRNHSVSVPIGKPLRRRCATLLLGEEDGSAIALSLVLDNPLEQTACVEIRGFNQQNDRFSLLLGLSQLESHGSLRVKNLVFLRNLSWHK